MPYKDPQKQKEAYRRWELKNRTGKPREGRKEYNAQYYQVNKERLDAYNRQWYADNREHVAEKAAAWAIRTAADVSSRATYLLTSCRSRAKKKGIPFSIVKENLIPALMRGVCDATGLPFVLERRQGRSPFSPSVDRIVLDQGYTPGNIRVILWAFNAACGNWGEDVLMQIVRARLSYMI